MSWEPTNSTNSIQLQTPPMINLAEDALHDSIQQLRTQSPVEIMTLRYSINILFMGYHEVNKETRWSVGNIISVAVRSHETIENVLMKNGNYDLRMNICGISSGWSPENCTISMQPQDTFEICCQSRPVRNWLLVFCAVTPEYIKKQALCWCCGRLSRHTYQNCPKRKICCYDSGQEHKPGKCPSNFKYKSTISKPSGVVSTTIKNDGQRMFVPPKNHKSKSKKPSQ